MIFDGLFKKSNTVAVKRIFCPQCTEKMSVDGVYQGNVFTCMKCSTLFKIILNSEGALWAVRVRDEKKYKYSNHNDSEDFNGKYENARQQTDRDQQRQNERASRATNEERKRTEREESQRHQSSSSHSQIKDRAYYVSVLGLKGDCTQSEVKRKYFELAAQYHPDKVNHLGPKLREVAEMEMKLINEARDFLVRN